MKRFLKRMAWLVVIVLVLLVGGITLITTLFEDRIGQSVLREVNQQLTTELQVEGFDLSFFRTFPDLGANLQNVQLRGTDGQPLLVAEELSFRAGLGSLFGDALKVTSVVLSQGELNIRTNARGENNYDVFHTSKANEQSDGSPSNTIELEEARVENMQLRYEDATTQQRVQLDVYEAAFDGRFGSDHYQLNSEAAIFLRQIVQEDQALLIGRPLEYKAALAVDGDTYSINNLSMQIGDLPLVVSGDITLKDATQMDLQIKSNDARLEHLLSLVPPDYRSNLTDLETGGDFDLKATVKGTYNEQQMPQIKADLNFSNGRLSGERIHARVRDLGFVAYYTNGTRRTTTTSKLVIENLHGEFEREPFAMDLSIENFAQPSVVFAANGTLAPGALLPFFTDPRISDGNGKIHLDNLSVRGNYADLQSGRRIDARGKIRFEQAGLIINDQDVRLTSGEVQLENNRLAIREVRLEAPDTRMQLNGQAFNVLPVLLADSVNSRKARLQFDASLIADKMDLDQLIALGDPAEEVQEAAEAEGQVDSLAQAELEKRAFFTEFLDGAFTAEVAEFNYNEIAGENFQGEIRFDQGTMYINGQTNAMEGQFELAGEMTFADRPVLTAKLAGDQISVYEFFRQSENFGQDFLVADNLSGTLDTRIFMECHFDNAGNFLTEELKVLAGVGLRDGVLQDFKMLEDFSTFVDIRDLREIRFTNLENFFEVRNSKLYIPAMFIQSNALNMTLSGTHTFDQDIEYYVKVNAGQVLTDRFRRHDPQLRPKRARRNGFFNLYYAVLGNLDTDYNFASDKRKVRRDFAESDDRRRTIHRELEERFGTVIEFINEPTDWRDIPDHQEDPDSQEPEFLDMEIEGGGG